MPYPFLSRIKTHQVTDNENYTRKSAIYADDNYIYTSYYYNDEHNIAAWTFNPVTENYTLVAYTPTASGYEALNISKMGTHIVAVETLRFSSYTFNGSSFTTIATLAPSKSFFISSILDPDIYCIDNNSKDLYRYTYDGSAFTYQTKLTSRNYYDVEASTNYVIATYYSVTEYYIRRYDRDLSNETDDHTTAIVSNAVSDSTYISTSGLGTPALQVGSIDNILSSTIVDGSSDSTYASEYNKRIIRAKLYTSSRIIASFSQYRSDTYPYCFRCISTSAVHLTKSATDVSGVYIGNFVIHKGYIHAVPGDVKERLWTTLTHKHAVTIHLYEALLTAEIYSHPQSVKKYVGETATFSVGATGSNLIYQWYSNVGGKIAPVSGATAANYSIPNITKSYHNKAVRVRVTDGRPEYIDSNNAFIEEVVEPMSYTGPFDVKVKSGNNASFQITKLNSEDLTYQWYEIIDGVTGGLTGATDNAYTYAVTGTDDGKQYTCKITDDIQSYNSPVATLTVAGSLVVNNPSNIYFFRGDTGVFSGGATGGIGGYLYQWERQDN